MALATRALALGAARGSAVAVLARFWLGRLLLEGIELLALPGLALHHCARKAWLWRRLPDGATTERQLLWLGVGFDGLGRALVASGSDVRVIETDHPDTLRQRRALVADDRIEMKALQLPGDLQALASICAARPTTIICEGMLMYLPKQTVVRALRTLAALPEPPRLIFTVLDTLQPGGRGFHRSAPTVRRWLERQGEPFRWRCSPTRVQCCLAAAGYEVTELWDGEGFGEYAIEATPSVPQRNTRSRW